MGRPSMVRFAYRIVLSVWLLGTFSISPVAAQTPSVPGQAPTNATAKPRSNATAHAVKVDNGAAATHPKGHGASSSKRSAPNAMPRTATAVGPAAPTSGSDTCGTTWGPIVRQADSTWQVPTDQWCSPAYPPGQTTTITVSLFDYNNVQIGSTQSTGVRAWSGEFFFNPVFGPTDLPTAPGTYTYTARLNRVSDLQPPEFYTSPDSQCKTDYGLRNNNQEEFCDDYITWTYTVSGTCNWSADVSQDGNGNITSTGLTSCSSPQPSGETSGGSSALDDWGGKLVAGPYAAPPGGSSGTGLTRSNANFLPNQQLQVQWTGQVTLPPGWTWGTPGSGCTLSNAGATITCIALSAGITVQRPQQDPECDHVFVSIDPAQQAGPGQASWAFEISTDDGIPRITDANGGGYWAHFDGPPPNGRPVQTGSLGATVAQFVPPASNVTGISSVADAGPGYVGAQLTFGITIKSVVDGSSLTCFRGSTSLPVAIS
jgi:hypothetical protein